MALFDLDDATCTVGYRNLRNAPAGTVGAEIKEGLEGLWGRYEAYADTDFSKEFVKQVEPRFWGDVPDGMPSCVTPEIAPARGVTGREAK